MKKNLCQYIFRENIKNVDGVSIEEIDSIYNLLRKKRKFESYKLNFIVLVGDYIITHSKKNSNYWGLLKIQQLLIQVLN